MNLISQLIQALYALLFVAFGAGAAIALPLDWVWVDHPVEMRHLTVQPPNIALAARAPPQTGDNVEIAGASSAGTGDVPALYDVAGLRDVSALLRSSIALNSHP